VFERHFNCTTISASKGNGLIRTIIVLVGCPGAGKGTQARIISRSLSISHISTGAILRDEIAANTEIGRKVQAQIKSGRLVIDEIVDDLIIQRVRQLDCVGGYILDGYPRTVAQAKSLERRVIRSPDRVLTIEIDVCIDELVSRLKCRLVCRGCHAVYNKETSPPFVEGLCDHCGSSLFQREDDREEAIRERFRIYRSSTRPLIDYFRSTGTYRMVNGMRPTEEVAQAIAEHLDSLFVFERASMPQSA
jgi:adenylate kinase